MAVGNYGVEIADDDVVLLNLKEPSDAGMLCIATYHLNEKVTINLKGPIVYHKETGRARQVVPLNAATLSLSHPMGN